MKIGAWRSDFFVNDLDWLRGCANLCLEEISPVEVLLLKKWRKKFAFLSLHVRCQGEAFLDQLAIWNLYPSQKIYVKWRHRKKLALWMPLTSLNAALYITHSVIASQDSSRVTTTFNGHSTRHHSGRFQRIFWESRLKVGTILYRTVRMISRAGAQRTGSWNCDLDSVVHYNLLQKCSVSSCEGTGIVSCEYKK